MKIEIRRGVFALGLISWLVIITMVSLSAYFEVWELKKENEILREAVISQIEMQIYINNLTEIFQKISNRISNLNDNVYGLNHKIDMVMKSILEAEDYFNDIINVGVAITELRNTILNNEYKNNKK